MEPCGKWQDSQPSMRTAACSNRNGPRLSVWHFRQGSSFARRLIDHSRPCAHAPRRSWRAVRIVAVRAGDDSFVHPMLGRHVELRANRSVTVITEVRLLLGEESFRTDRSVNRMTTVACDVVLGVLRASNFGAAHIFGVATEAVIKDHASRTTR